MSISQTNQKGLFAGLLDINFTTFVTLKFLKVIYVILLVLIALGTISFFFTSLLRGGAGGIFVAFIVVPLVAFLYVVLARIYLEILALFFRIGENTSAIAAALTSGPPAGPATGYSGYQPPPAPPAAPGYQPPTA